MADTVIAISPRITDPSMKKPVEESRQGSLGDSTARSEAQKTRGLFTSMYENKMIVVIIIITIIFIGILAYFVFKKSDDDADDRPAQPKPRPPVPRVTTPQASPQPSVAPAAPTPRPTPVIQTPRPTTPVQSSPPTRSQHEQTRETDEVAITVNESAQQQPVQENNNAATTLDTEIAPDQQTEQPMTNVDILALYNNTHVANEPSTLQDTSYNDTQYYEYENDPSESDETRPSICSASLKNGKKCRNKSLAGGKCRMHGG